MDMNDLHPPDDYSHRFFIWHEWLQVNGPLTTENVFNYFATSMFYDKQSNNQVLRMQTMHTGMPILNEAEELKRFTGVEFALVHAVPPSMFIIHKRERLSPEEVRPLAAYFIMNNRIYQSPDLYTVLSNRLLTSLYSLQSSLDILRTHRPDFTPRTGFVWPIADPSVAVADDPSKRRGTSEEPSSLDDDNHHQQDSFSDTPGKRKMATAGPKRQQNIALLLNAMRTTAAHSKLAFPSRTSALGEPGGAVPPSEPGAGVGAGTSASASASASASTIVPGAGTQSSATSTPAASQELPQKAGAGGGKKKRKRTSLAQPVA